MNKKILFLLLSLSPVSLLMAKKTIVPRVNLDGEKVPGLKDAVFKQMAIFLPKNGLNIVYDNSPAADQIKEATKIGAGSKIMMGVAFVTAAPALPIVGVLGGVGVAIANSQDYVLVNYFTYVSFKDKSSSSINIAPVSCSGYYSKLSGKLQMNRCFTNEARAGYISGKSKIFWPKNITLNKDRNDPQRDQIWFKGKYAPLNETVVTYSKK